LYPPRWGLWHYAPRCSSFGLSRAVLNYPYIKSGRSVCLFVLFCLFCSVRWIVHDSEYSRGPRWLARVRGRHRGSWCSRRVFSTFGDCLRSAQSVSTLGHTKDRTSDPLENVGIGLARPGTVRIHRKTPSHTPGTTRNWPPLSRMRRLLPVEDDVDQHHKTGLYIKRCKRPHSYLSRIPIGRTVYSDGSSV